MAAQKIILVTGTRRVGKDTFVELLRDSSLAPFLPIRYAFADELKIECESLSWFLFEKSISDLSHAEKEIFRPILIAVGMAAREIDPLFWVKKVEAKIDYVIRLTIGNPEIFLLPILADNRFSNETKYFVDKYGKENVCVVGISREDNPEPTEEEKQHNPGLQSYINYRIHWPAVGDSERSKLTPYIEDFITYWKEHYGNS